MHITLTRRGISVDITLQHASYGMDRFGFAYAWSHPGFWREHGTGRLWMELSRSQTAALREAA